MTEVDEADQERKPTQAEYAQAQAAKAMLVVDKRLGRPSDPRVVELAKRARGSRDR